MRLRKKYRKRGRIPFYGTDDGRTTDRGKMEFNEVDEEGMNVLTNTQRMYGAVGILTESIQKKLEGKWIIPSSVHECIILPNTIPLETCETILKEVNDKQLQPEEVLSYSVYWIQDGKLTRA